MDDDGHGVLSDFSAAKGMGEVPYSVFEGVITDWGTRFYKCPELAENKPISTAGDVYSWAMTSLPVVSGRA